MIEVTLCEGPDCPGFADWFIGLKYASPVGRGHFACDEHLADGVRETLRQLRIEGYKLEGCSVIPIKALVVTDSRA